MSIFSSPPESQSYFCSEPTFGSEKNTTSSTESRTTEVKTYEEYREWVTKLTVFDDMIEKIKQHSSTGNMGSISELITLLRHNRKSGKSFTREFARKDPCFAVWLNRHVPDFAHMLYILKRENNHWFRFSVMEAICEELNFNCVLGKSALDVFTVCTLIDIEMT